MRREHLAGEYFFKVSNCAQKSSHLRFHFFSIGSFAPPPAPVSEAPEYRRRLRKRVPHSGALAIGRTSRLDCPKEGYQWVRRQITGRANCHAGSQLVPPMWSKELAARKGICALSPATWFCLADGASIFLETTNDIDITCRTTRPGHSARFLPDAIHLRSAARRPRSSS
jgi:hypothetical protein